MTDFNNIEDIIAREGRLSARPKNRWPVTTVAAIDFECLYEGLRTPLYWTLRDHNPFRRLYDGTQIEIDDAIENDVNALCVQAIKELWNRLRAIAETYDNAVRNDVFKRKAPSFEGFQLPRFYASLLSSIGPLCIQDSFRDTTVIYAPARARSNNFGFKIDHASSPINILKIIDRLCAAGFPLDNIQLRGSQGAYFTTCANIDRGSDDHEVVGMFHQCNYTRTDVAMALLFSAPGSGNHPFQDLSITIGHVTDESTLRAFEAIAPPTASDHADGDPRPVGGTYSINYFGIAPASDVPVAGCRRGIYVVGRGRERQFTCSLARHLSTVEINMSPQHSRDKHDHPQPHPRRSDRPTSRRTATLIDRVQFSVPQLVILTMLFCCFMVCSMSTKLVNNLMERLTFQSI